MSYLNSEHYYDPTAGQAMENVVREARRIRADAEVMIGRISDPRSQKVMILYYLDGKKLAETAEECDYSKRQIIRLRNVGLEELENLLQSTNEKVVNAKHQNEPT